MPSKWTQARRLGGLMGRPVCCIKRARDIGSPLARQSDLSEAASLVSVAICSCQPSIAPDGFQPQNSFCAFVHRESCGLQTCPCQSSRRCTLGRKQHERVLVRQVGYDQHRVDSGIMVLLHMTTTPETTAEYVTREGDETRVGQWLAEWVSERPCLTHTSDLSLTLR